MLRRGLLVALLAQAARATDEVELTFEILPPADETEATSVESAVQFMDAIHGAAGDRSARPGVDSLPLLSATARKVEQFEIIRDPDHIAVDITSQSKLRARAAADILISGMGGLVGKMVDQMDITSGGLNFQSSGSMSVVGGEAEILSLGDVSAMASGAANLGAESIVGRVSEGILAEAGGDVGVVTGGSATMETRGDGTATFGGGLKATAKKITIESSEGLDATAQAVGVLGRDGVTVGTLGTKIDLVADVAMEYVAFVWKSTVGFDEWRNMMPTPVVDAEELFIQCTGGNNALVQSNGAHTEISLTLGIQDNDTEEVRWERIWGTTIGRGTYSLNGTRINWGGQITVVGIQLESAPHNIPSFDGWGEVTFFFGRVASTGQVNLQSSGTMEAVAGESLTVMAPEVGLNAGKSIDISSGGELNIISDTINLQADGLLQASVQQVQLIVDDNIDLFSQGAATMTTGSITATVQTDVDLVAGGNLAIVGGQSASIEVRDQVGLHATSALINLDGGLTAHAGGQTRLSTSGATVDVDSDIKVFAGQSAQLTTTDVSVDALGEISVRTQKATIDAIWGVKLSAASVEVVSSQEMSISSQTLTASSEGDVAIGTGGELKAHAAGGVKVSTLGGVEATIAEKVEASVGSLNIRSEGEARLLTNSVVADVEGNITGYAAGTADVVIGESVGMGVGGNADIAMGGKASVWAGSDVKIEGAAAGSASFGGALDVDALSLSLASKDSLDVKAKTMDVEAKDSVAVGTEGTLLQLTSASAVQHVPYMWKSSSSFEEWAQPFTKVENVQEIIVQSDIENGAAVLGGISGTTIAFDIQYEDRDTGAATWKHVWGTEIRAGTHSLDGLHLPLGGTYDVVGIRLTSDPHNLPSFDLWGKVTLLFGVVASAGAVNLQSSGTFEAVAGESLTVMAPEVGLSASGSIDISSGEDLSVLAGELNLMSEGKMGVAVDSLEMTVDDDVALYTQGDLTATSASMAATVNDDVSLTSGGDLSAVAESANIEVQHFLDLAAESASMTLEGELDAYAGKSMKLGTGDLDVNAGGLMTAFAGDMAELTTGAGGVSVSTSGDVSLQTADHSVEMNQIQARLLSNGKVKLDSRTLDASAGEVTVSGGNTNANIARLTVKLDCTINPEGCTGSAESEATMLEELAQIAGVPVARLRIRALSDQLNSPSPSPTMAPSGTHNVHVEDVHRLGGRRLESDPASNKYGTDTTNEERTAKQLGAMKDLKKKILKQIMGFFKSSPLGRSTGVKEKKAIMSKVMSYDLQDDVAELWDMFTNGSADESPSDMAAFMQTMAIL